MIRIIPAINVKDQVMSQSKMFITLTEEGVIGLIETYIMERLAISAADIVSVTFNRENELLEVQIEINEIKND